MEMKHKEITEQIISAAFYVHNALGWGFLEKVYQNAMIVKLKKDGVKVDVEVPVKVYFENELVGDYFADLMVEDTIIVELKAVKELNPAHDAQLVNYLKATGMNVGLLINFGESVKVKRKVFDKSFKSEKSV